MLLKSMCRPFIRLHPFAFCRRDPHTPPHMARLSDVPVVLRSYGLWGFSKRVWDEINEDQTLAWAAALAYSWLFAIFPFLIFLMTLLPYLPQELKGTAHHEVH